MDKDFHVVIWGATGFTGRLVSLYMCERYGAAGDVRWAIAGRNEAKLKAVQQELIAIDPKAAESSYLHAVPPHRQCMGKGIKEGVDDCFGVASFHARHPFRHPTDQLLLGHFFPSICVR